VTDAARLRASEHGLSANQARLPPSFGTVPKCSHDVLPCMLWVSVNNLCVRACRSTAPCAS
jgi:hypothetical protein